MTVKLEFNLDEPEDVQKFNRCNKSLDLTLCLFNIREEMIKNSKINQKQFFALLSSYNIDLEQLIS